MSVPFSTLAIVTDDSSADVSITAHGGIINGLLNATGRARYALPTGGVPRYYHPFYMVDDNQVSSLSLSRLLLHRSHSSTTNVHNSPNNMVHAKVRSTDNSYDFSVHSSRPVELHGAPLLRSNHDAALVCGWIGIWRREHEIRWRFRGRRPLLRRAEPAQHAKPSAKLGRASRRC